jgi:lipoate-protein ligase A
VGREALYRTVHTTLIEALSDWSVTASLYEGHDGRRPEQQPFLCFQRRAPGDVVLGPFKIAGSAQRRAQGAILQHGSILLARSAAAVELPGIEDLAGIRLDAEQLLQAWRARLAEGLRLAWEPTTLPEPQRALAAELAAAKYAAPSWTENRGR